MDMLPFNVLQHGATRTSRLARHTRHARHMFRGVATAWTGEDMSTSLFQKLLLRVMQIQSTKD